MVKNRWRKILKILRLNKPCRFDSGHLHHKSIKAFEIYNLDAFIIKLLEFSNKFLTILENAYLLGILESKSNISFLFVLISILVLKLNAFSMADAEFIFVLESK